MFHSITINLNFTSKNAMYIIHLIPSKYKHLCWKKNSNLTTKTFCTLLMTALFYIFVKECKTKMFVMNFHAITATLFSAARKIRKYTGLIKTYLIWTRHKWAKNKTKNIDNAQIINQANSDFGRELFHVNLCLLIFDCFYYLKWMFETASMATSQILGI